MVQKEFLNIILNFKFLASTQKSKTSNLALSNSSSSSRPKSRMKNRMKNNNNIIIIIKVLVCINLLFHHSSCIYLHNEAFFSHTYANHQLVVGLF